MRKELLKITVLLNILFSTIPLVHAQTAPTVFKKIFDVKSGGELTLNSELGTIDVKTTGLNKVEIVVTKKAEKPDPALLKALEIQEPFTEIDIAKALDDFKVTFKQDENSVHIDGNFKTGREHWEKKFLLLSLLKIHFEVKIPHRYSVNLNTSRDGISVVDFIGGVRVETSGDLRIGEVKGPVWGRTSSSGDITLNECQGDVDVEASIGNIDLGNVIGDVKAKTGSSGSVTLKGCQGNVDIVTSIGNINLGDVTGDVSAKGGDIEIGNVGGKVIARASSSGNITLKGCQGNVDVEASIGDIDLGSVSGILKAKTGSSGNITLKKCESDVDVEASIGDVNLTNITGTVKAGGGDIEISNVKGMLTARASSSGNITLKDCQDNVDVEASIGDIDLTDIIGSVKATTGSSGRITLNNCQNDVEVTASIGDVELTNISGTVNASGGDIEINNAGGAVMAQASSSGNVTLKDCQDNVEVKASIGDIDLTNISGTVKATTGGSGKITLHNCQGGVNAGTSIGDIRAEIIRQPNHQWTLETSGSGQITATLMPGIAVDIDAQTNRGSISSDFAVQGFTSKNSLKGMINGGGVLLKLRASSGDLRLRKN